MRELTESEVGVVGAAVSQDTAIGSNLAIVGVGVGIMVAGATAPAWFPIMMIATSISITASYIYNC
ncbi:MAG: hypothetical protein RQ899_02610 [Pseudomonadales bacterium]|nr:hypothetical protein [Pseudomonadales bacterium]